MTDHMCPKCESKMTSGYLLEKNMPIIEGDVILRLKQYHLFAPQTVPLLLLSLALCRFGTV